MITFLKKIIPFSITLIVICLFYFSRLEIFKLYPIIANSFVFVVFFVSLFQEETIIQKIAKKCEKGPLDEFTQNYTKKLTYAWVIFLGINILLAIITAFLSDKIWMLYNGFISYLILGLFFIIEYIIRVILRKRARTK